MSQTYLTEWVTHISLKGAGYLYTLSQEALVDGCSSRLEGIDFLPLLSFCAHM